MLKEVLTLNFFSKGPTYCAVYVDMNNDKKKTDPNDVVSPKNTEKLYGSRADQEEARPGDAETIEQSLPEDFSGVDQDVAENMFPSKSAHDPHDLKDQ